MIELCLSNSAGLEVRFLLSALMFCCNLISVMRVLMYYENGTVSKSDIGPEEEWEGRGRDFNAYCERKIKEILVLLNLS